MRIVLDASALVALITREPESESVALKFASWAEDGAELHAPELARDEVANALTRKAAHGDVDRGDLAAVWTALDALPISYHPLADGAEAIELALDLDRHSAFDAAYVALATRIGAELWTIDGPLARNAGGRGHPVRLISGTA